MLQTTQIELKPKYCVFFVNSLGYIQFTPQLFSTMSSPTRLGRLACQIITSTNYHQTKYKVNNPKVGSLSLTGQLQGSLPCLVDVANHTYRTQTKGFYIPRKIIQVFSLHLNCFQRCCFQQVQEDQRAQRSQVKKHHQTKYEVNNPKGKQSLLFCQLQSSIQGL